jgi:ABC-type branched-subunit amino acid transport system substrate-binding protein
MANTFSSDTILQWRYIADIAAKYIQLNNLIPWQYTMRMFEVETTSNGGQATLNTVDLYNTIEPVAVVGPGRAQVCLDLQNVLGVLRIPHVSPTATATVLSNQALAPSFLRVTPTDYASARIVDHFMKDNNWLHIAFLVSQDEFAGSTDHG